MNSKSLVAKKVLYPVMRGLAIKQRRIWKHNDISYPIIRYCVRS